MLYAAASLVTGPALAMMARIVIQAVASCLPRYDLLTLRPLAKRYVTVSRVPDCELSEIPVT